MTLYYVDDVDVIDDVTEASDDDLRQAYDNALKSAGLSFEELEGQARTGHFRTVKARLAWIAVSGLARV